jgi:hypothetical protein
MRENPSFDDAHLDAACAWLNVEFTLAVEGS